MKLILQLKNSIDVGGQYYDKLAGDFSVDNDSQLVSAVVVSLGGATLLLRFDDIFCPLIFPDDANLSAMDSTALLVN